MMVPKDLRPLVGKTEFRYSLRARTQTTAKHRATGLAVHVKAVFESIRNGGRMSKLTAKQINEIVRQYVQECLQDDEEYRACASKPRTREDLENQEHGLWSVQYDIKEALALNDYSIAEGVITRMDLLKGHGIKIDKKSSQYKMFRRELMKGIIEINDIALAREVGDYSKEPKPPLQAPQMAQPKPAPKPSKRKTDGVPLSEVIEQYIKEQTEGGEWTDKTEQERRGAYGTFQEFLGKDVGIKTIDREKILEFRNALIKLPPNRKKAVPYKSMSMKQILSMNLPEEKRMSPATANDILSCIQALFKYAYLEERVDKDPTGRIKVPDKRPDRDKRHPFSEEDLKALFNAPRYREDSFKHSYQYWCPILGLFTGARVNEIAQLHLDDFRLVDDVWCMDINRSTKDKRLKNPSSARIVPLHPFLVKDLDLIRYVETLKAKGHKRLFQELTKQRDGHGRPVSTWFNNDFRLSNGITKDSKKTFHSFRHTFITALKHAGVPELIANELDGHSSGKTESYSTYGGRYSPKQLLEEGLLKLDFGLDLSHLKNSKYSGNY
ncbi:MAG: site-specific integrase [Desulfatibacillum sp.]|nr:site-specific integrase [Desulfatibacillum sp.]